VDGIFQNWKGEGGKWKRMKFRTGSVKSKMFSVLGARPDSTELHWSVYTWDHAGAWL